MNPETKKSIETITLCVDQIIYLNDLLSKNGFTQHTQSTKETMLTALKTINELMLNQLNELKNDNN